MRTVSLNMRSAMMDQNGGGELPIVLLTITHPSLTAPLYLSGDPTTRISDSPPTYATASRGRNYLYIPFSLVLPDDVTERAPSARLMLDNVDRRLISLVRSIDTPPSITIEIILRSSPDVVEMAWPNFQIKSAPYGASTMTIELGIDALSDEPFPGDSFDSVGFPALF